MEITIDFSHLINFLSLPSDVMLMKVLFTVGWVPILIAFLQGMKAAWMNYIQNQYAVANLNAIVLAVDIPRGNNQTPKAVENLLTYIAGAHSSNNLIEEYWDGKYQFCASLEIVSIEGYVQYLIRIPGSWKNMTEAAIYSQYPDAQIAEVEDYTKPFPTKYPNDEYDLFGFEIIQTDDDALPIRSYKKFIDEVPGKDYSVFKDPISSLMTVMSSLGQGEHLWYQIIIKPTDAGWTKKSDEQISVILKETKPKEKGLIGGFFGFFLELFDEFFSAFTGMKIFSNGAEEKPSDPLKMMNLKPKQKKQVEAIQEKVAKTGFFVKMRMVYIAKKEVMNKPKVANGFNGYMKQFAEQDLNSLKPEFYLTGTKTAYITAENRLNRKKTKLFKAYSSRDNYMGTVPKVFNVEEIASLWHFPIEEITKAPMLQKTSARRIEAPMSLPIKEAPAQEIKNMIFDEEVVKGKTSYVKERKKEDVFKEEVIDANNNTEDIVRIIKKEDQKPAIQDANSKNNSTHSAPPSNLPFV